MVGGAELLSQESPNLTVSKDVSNLTRSLQIKVSEIMKQIESSKSLQDIKWPDIGPARKAVMQIRFWLPVIFVAGLVVFGDYLTKSFRHLSVGLLTYITQVLIFLIVVFVLYRALTTLSLLSNKRKKAELKLEAQAQELDKARSDLISSTDEKLSTDSIAMGTLIGKVPETSGAMVSLQEGLRRLRNIVDTFKLVNSVETNKLDVEAAFGEQTIASDVLEASLDSLKPLSSAKAVELKLPHNANIPLPGNIRLVSQVISSILENAVEFSPNGGLVIVHMGSNAKWTTMTITDQGEGVSKDELDHLFKPFTRTDHLDALEMNHDGIGVNLYLDKMIMEKLGGDISVRTKLHHGTTFILTWPTVKEHFSGETVFGRSHYNA